jgi:hypothetical protein
MGALARRALGPSAGDPLRSRNSRAVEIDHSVTANTPAECRRDYIVHAAWPSASQQVLVSRAAQRWETVMEIHSTSRLACLAAVLAAGLAGMAYDAKAGGLKGGANTASPGTPSKNPVKGSPTVVYPGPVIVGPPPPPGKGGGCPKGACKH